MSPRIIVRSWLTREEIGVCHDWTVERIKPENVNRYSHALRYTDDASTNYAIQMNGKVCEAGAHKHCLGDIKKLYRGFDPDRGSDLKFFSEKVEVKGMIGLYRQLLIYPIRLWEIGAYETQDFTVLMMARADRFVIEGEPDSPHQWTGQVELVGWVTKPEFLTKHKIAGDPKGHPLASKLEPGTPYMHMGDLRDIATLANGKVITDCVTCGARGEFGYRKDGQMHWYCPEHRLGQWYADARRR
jgi:hypothetical protein